MYLRTYVTSIHTPIRSHTSRVFQNVNSIPLASSVFGYGRHKNDLGQGSLVTIQNTLCKPNLTDNGLSQYGRQDPISSQDRSEGIPADRHGAKYKVRYHRASVATLTRAWADDRYISRQWSAPKTWHTVVVIASNQNGIPERYKIYPKILDTSMSRACVYGAASGSTGSAVPAASRGSRPDVPTLTCTNLHATVIKCNSFLLMITWSEIISIGIPRFVWTLTGRRKYFTSSAL